MTLRLTPCSGWPELWSLREDISLSVPPMGHTVELHSPGVAVLLADPTGVIGMALYRLCLGPIRLANVLAGLTDLQRLEIQRLFTTIEGLLVRSLATQTGRPLLSVVPLSPQAQFRPALLPAHRTVVLSRSAALRRQGQAHVLQAPRALHRVVLHLADALRIIELLRVPTRVADITAAAGAPPSAAAVLAFLTASGMVTTGSADGAPAVGVGEQHGTAPAHPPPGTAEVLGRDAGSGDGDPPVRREPGGRPPPNRPGRPAAPGSAGVENPSLGRGATGTNHPLAH
ncbi:hypothetical protein ACIBVL_15540 [Streptomyces sp. NPDC049687]|uniref:hypothetical protein n=1 Tax=Streptomyces sp. NPDC049687 TaxID=3365596 RepID=UPI00379A3FD9